MGEFQFSLFENYTLIFIPFFAPFLLFQRTKSTGNQKLPMQISPQWAKEDISKKMHNSLGICDMNGRVMPHANILFVFYLPMLNLSEHIY